MSTAIPTSNSMLTDQPAPPAPLPKRPASGVPKSPKPPVWSIERSELTESCARYSRADGICCKELKKDERRLLDPDVVRDVVIGLSDGLTVPFALTAGLSSLGQSKLVVLGGIAELIAGAISMGIGGFLASQAERDHFRYLHQQTSARVMQSCDGEMEREVTDVLGPTGVDEKTCRAVAKCLRDVEFEPSDRGNSFSSGDADAEQGSLKWSNQVGLTAFLLKFGHGMEEVPTRRLYTSAFTIGMGYLVGGIIPLLPYFFIPQAGVALIYSSVITGIVLLIFGAIKARVTGAGAGASGYLWGAVSTLLVGGLAAGAAFGIVRALEGGS